MIQPILAQAQTLDAVPATWWKYFCIALLVLLGVAVAVVLIIQAVRKPAPVKVMDEPAIKVEKTSKRYNHDAVEQRFGRIESRIDGHDAEIDAAWLEMKAMRKEAADANLGIAVSLAKIEVKLGITEKK